MKTIIAKCGAVIMVDDEDFDLVSAHKWSLNGSRYPRSYVWNKEKRHSDVLYMHRLLTGRHGVSDGLAVDHIDGNPLNNRRSNLRICTYFQNNCNKGKQPTNTSGYKGVYFHKQMKKWQAQIMVKGRNIYLGLFESAEEAHEVYCLAAVMLHGEFANLGEGEKNDRIEQAA